MKLKTLLFALIVSIMTASAAHAAPVTWTLDNVTFTNGVIATGSFVFNEDAGIFSDVFITTTPGDDLTLIGPANAGGALDVFSADGGIVGGEFIQLAFSELLTNAGGTISLVGLSPAGFSTFIAFCDVGGTPGGAFCPLIDFVLISTGSVVASEVPLPAAFWFMGASIAAYAAARKKIAAA